MDIQVAYMVETTIADSSQQITLGQSRDSYIPVKQSAKNIMDDVARKIIVMQKYRGLPMHLRIMLFEQLFYVGPMCHTQI